MKTTVHQKRGFAIISVLFIIAGLSLMLGMLIQIGGQRAFTARRLVNQVKALAYAEAGIDYAYSILSTDFDQKHNPDAFQMEEGGGGQTAALNPSSDGFFRLMMGGGAQSSYSDGSFDITLTLIDDKYVIVNSVGKCGDETDTAEVLIDDEAVEEAPLPQTIPAWKASTMPS